MTADLAADSDTLRRRLARPALEVAPRLLGWQLSHTTSEGTVSVRLTEVEAYEGSADPAPHAYRGRTARNAVMFGPAGHLYCYFSYGMHWCANVVCGADDVASAVLLRAGRVVAGVELARSRRGERVANTDLARGPASLTRALGIDGSCSGVDLLDEQAPLRLVPGSVDGAVDHGPRVGIRHAAERPWRFWLSGDATVSAYRRGGRSRPARDVTP